MSEALLTEITECLEGPLDVVEERRGFGRQRGVPDSVFWLQPSDGRISVRPLPVLVELEGTFANAMDDFSKFAGRYGEPEFQYCIQWPVVGEMGREPLRIPIQYEIIGIRANQLTSEREISEHSMQIALEEWFDTFLEGFETEVIMRYFLEVPFAEWQVSFTMFGHEFETRMPFIINHNTYISKGVIERITPPRLPGVVVVNGKYDQREVTTVVHETAVEFPTINPILFD